MVPNFNIIKYIYFATLFHQISGRDTFFLNKINIYSIVDQQP